MTRVVDNRTQTISKATLASINEAVMGHNIAKHAWERQNEKTSELDHLRHMRPKIPTAENEEAPDLRGMPGEAESDPEGPRPGAEPGDPRGTEQ